MISALRQRWLQILWPAFLMAGVLEVLLFAVVDPGDLRWFGGAEFGWPRQAVYTVTFLLFWSVTSVSGGLTMLLTRSDAEMNRQDPF